MNETTPDKAAGYTPPKIEARGSLNELTQGGSASGKLDASYPVGTPSGWNLFS